MINRRSLSAEAVFTLARFKTKTGEGDIENHWEVIVASVLKRAIQVKSAEIEREIREA